MSTKELIFKEIEQIPEPYLETVLKMVQNFRQHKVRMFKGRPILRKEDINEKTWPYPPEPDGEEIWRELNQE
jgi:hypothetical protein